MGRASERSWWEVERMGLRVWYAMEIDEGNGNERWGSLFVTMKMLRSGDEMPVGVSLA